MILKESDIKRFWQKVDVQQDKDACWQWLGYRAKECGHGRFNLNRKITLAHRISYFLKNGKIPKYMVVRHTCNFGSCCNPNHLILGTQADNIMDMRNNINPIIREDHPLPNNRPWAKFNGRKNVPVEERFWDKVDKVNDGCWLWKGALFSNGYGHFQVNGSPATIANIVNRKTWKHI